MTARWVVDDIAEARDLNITWQPISLLLKNQPAADSDWYAPNLFTHKLLRVMEAARAKYGDDAVFSAYWEFARRIHHDDQYDFDPAEALGLAGLDPSLAAAFDDDSWDVEIEARMGVGLDLAGTDIGTPIIALDDVAGRRVGIFGPVLTRIPPADQTLAIWDAFVTLATTQGFWELKRTRTDRPEFPDAPDRSVYAQR